jgi:hypothetical protein
MTEETMLRDPGPQQIEPLAEAAPGTRCTRMKLTGCHQRTRVHRGAHVIPLPTTRLCAPAQERGAHSVAQWCASAHQR